MTTSFKRPSRKAIAWAHLLGGAALSMGLLGADQAQAQNLCAEYAIVRGDTLSEIAKRAGVRGGFKTIYRANRNVLTNPNRVEIGQVLRIPCADGRLHAARTAAVAPEPAVATPEPVAETPKRPIRVVTASGYAPFTDESLEGGGALTVMVDRALSEGNSDLAYQISFVNDWGAHLESLLPSGAMDMTFPWYKPDCSKVEFLSPASASRCEDFNHSEPLYDAQVGYYALNGSDYANATTYADLQGARLCRPEAWFTFDLEAEQLMPPNVELIQPIAQNGCWELLLEGEVDVVTLDALPAEEDYRELGLSDRIAKIDSLSSKQTLHVFVAKDNAFANEALPIINAGLEKIRLSGEWFEIVKSGILETVNN